MIPRIYLLLLQIFIFQLGFGMIVPILPALGQSLGMNAAGIGLVVGIYGLSRVLAALPTVPIVRWIGFRRTFALGAAILAVGSVICGLAETSNWLLIGRFVSGFGAATSMVSGQSMAAERPEPFTRARSLGYYQTAFHAGLTVGPSVGGIVTDLVGAQMTFFLYAALLVFVTLLGAFDSSRHEGTSEAIGSAAGWWRPLPSLFRQRTFVLPSMMMALQAFTRTGAVHALVPLLGAVSLGLSATQVGLALALMSLVDVGTALVAARVIDRVGPIPMAITGGALVAASFIGFATAGSPQVYFVTAAVWGIGAAMSGVSNAVLVTTEKKGAKSLEAVALYRGLGDIGYVLGPVTLGAVAAIWGMTVAFTAAAVIFIVMTAAYAKIGSAKPA